LEVGKVEFVRFEKIDPNDRLSETLKLMDPPGSLVPGSSSFYIL
jgi:hypothetical protein